MHGEEGFGLEWPSLGHGFLKLRLDRLGKRSAPIGVVDAILETGLEVDRGQVRAPQGSEVRLHVRRRPAHRFQTPSEGRRRRGKYDCATAPSALHQRLLL